MNDKKKKDNLKQQAVNSSGWGFVDKGSNVVVQFIIGIVLARLLPPSVFGLIGLALIVVGFGQIFVNLGLGSSLIQKQGITQRHVRVIFTISVIAGIFLTVIIFWGAPLGTIILNSKNVTPILKVLSVVFIFAGLQIPSQALLKKRLDFKHLFYVSFAKNIIYGVLTISLALTGFGVWSLVIGNIFRRVISLAGSYWYVRHNIKPLFAKKEFFDLIHFSSGITLSSIWNYFARQGDFFMIGRLLGANALGLYTRAFSLMEKPTTQFVHVLSNVLFPTASRIQDDSKRLRNIFLKTMRVIAFITIPLCTLIVILAPQIIVGLYGENWRGSIIPLQILGGFGIFRAMYNTAAVFLKAKGWVYPIFYTQIIYGSTMLLGVWLGAKWFGLNGATAAAGGSIVIMWALQMELNARATKIKRSKIFSTLIPGLIIGISTGLPALLFKLAIKNYFTSKLLVLILTLLLSLIILILSIIIIPQKYLSYIPNEFLDIVHNYVPKQKSKYISKFENLVK